MRICTFYSAKEKVVVQEKIEDQVLDEFDIFLHFITNPQNERFSSADRRKYKCLYFLTWIHFFKSLNFNKLILQKGTEFLSHPQSF